MVELVPCVIKTTSIGEVTLRYLDKSTIYLERVEGLGKKRTRREYTLNLCKSTKALVPTAFPPAPYEFHMNTLRAQEIADLLWSQVWGHWGYNNQPGCKETMEALEQFIYGKASNAIVKYVTDNVESIATSCEVLWTELTERESLIVAGFITANGDKKLLVQSMKAHGYDDFEMKSGANYMTGSWDFPDLEGYLLSHR